MSLKKYLKDHRLHLLLGLLAEGVVEAVLWLFASPVALQGFAFFWLTGSIGVIFGYDFLRKRKFYKKVGKEYCLCNGLKCLQIYLQILKCNCY